jgi:hypothetical protein
VIGDFERRLAIVEQDGYGSRSAVTP